MSKRIYVWDILVRTFHWSLVFFFIIAFASGDDAGQLHIYAGYIILGLLAIRILWGFIGTQYARFSNFNFSINGLIGYLKSFIGLPHEKKYIGHNPAGSWMVIALFVALSVTGVSGMLAHGDLQLTAGNQTQTVLASPYMKVSSDEHEDDEHEREGEGNEFWEEIHEGLANFTLFLVMLHIAGVIASSLKQRQNLARSMINGYKNVE